MVDHVFTDAIDALRRALESALLDRLALEERFQADVLLGDLTWATQYGLPGEGSPPRVRADITLDWPTWAQTAYRRWYLGDRLDEPPRIEIEIVLRVQDLVALPDPDRVLAALPPSTAPIGDERLERSAPRVEIAYGDDGEVLSHAIEMSYEGSYELTPSTLAARHELDTHFAALGAWISSALVRLGDLRLEFLPANDDQPD